MISALILPFEKIAEMTKMSFVSEPLGFLRRSAFWAEMTAVAAIAVVALMSFTNPAAAGILTNMWTAIQGLPALAATKGIGPLGALFRFEGALLANGWNALGTVFSSALNGIGIGIEAATSAATATNTAVSTSAAAALTTAPTTPAIVAAAASPTPAAVTHAVLASTSTATSPNLFAMQAMQMQAGGMSFG